MSIVSAGSKILSHNGQSIKAGVFSTAKGKVAQKLNMIALRTPEFDRMSYTFPKATPEDLIRLTSKKLEDSYKRVTWTNPNDNKVYHILEEGRENGKVQVRILDQEGEFIKNAELEPKNIVLFDNFFSPIGITHGEMMETFLRRFNPFANVERLEHKKGLIENIRYFRKLPQDLQFKRFKELSEEMENGKKVDYITFSETDMFNAEDVIGEPGIKQKKYLEKDYFVNLFSPLFQKIMSKGTRIFGAAGNDEHFAKEIVSSRLVIDGVEGVGSLSGRKIAKNSCSRNSIFTQHYEQNDYICREVLDDNGKIIGINVTGQMGIDLPLNWKTKKLIGRHVCGTSYATPIRVAKLALNDMMQGII